MRRLMFLFACLLALPTSAAPAAEPNPKVTRTSHSEPIHPQLSSSEITATPEMWFYEQQAIRHDNAKLAVREKAEFEAAQRERRLAAQKWFGFSNQRPTASPDPYSSYSPMWVGNNLHDPSQWRGVAATPLIVPTQVDVVR